MFLIVGLGNIGESYTKTRHNAGFLFADFFADDLGFGFEKNGFHSSCREKTIVGDKFVVQKPKTFMNESGSAVLAISSFYKIPSSNVFVVHDDIDLSFGEVRIKFSGGHGGHNGLRSIDSHVGKEYWRVRIGVGRPELKTDVAHYVLSSFSSGEIAFLHSNIFNVLSENFVSLVTAGDLQEKTDTIAKIIKATKPK